MRLAAASTLNAYITTIGNGPVAAELRTWRDVVLTAHWHSGQDVQRSFPSASPIPGTVAGWRFPLTTGVVVITTVDLTGQIVYVGQVF